MAWVGYAPMVKDHLTWGEIYFKGAFWYQSSFFRSEGWTAQTTEGDPVANSYPP